jgi:5'-3' exonuclease
MRRHLLLDGNNAVGIATYAIERDKKGKKGMSLKSKSGIPTGGLFVYLKTLQKTIVALAPHKLTVCWDGGKSAYRKSIYPEYKVRERDEIYQIFLAQIDLAQKISPCLGFGNLRIQGYEGDDAIYLMHRSILLEQDDTEVVVVSSDKDMLQLVGDRTTAYSTTMGIEVTPENFGEYTGLPLEHYIRCRAMIGDTSDGIPGIPGIGPATAKKIVNGDDSLSSFARRRGIDIKECSQIVKRNKLLMDLSLVPYEDDEELDIQTWGGHEPSFEEFKMWSLELDFLSLLDSARQFFSPFLNMGKERCF